MGSSNAKPVSTAFEHYYIVEHYRDLNYSGTGRNDMRELEVLMNAWVASQCGENLSSSTSQLIAEITKTLLPGPCSKAFQLAVLTFSELTNVKDRANLPEILKDVDQILLSNHLAQLQGVVSASIDQVFNLMPATMDQQCKRMRLLEVEMNLDNAICQIEKLIEQRPYAWDRRQAQLFDVWRLAVSTRLAALQAQVEMNVIDKRGLLQQRSLYQDKLRELHQSYMQFRRSMVETGLKEVEGVWRSVPVENEVTDVVYNAPCEYWRLVDKYTQRCFHGNSRVPTRKREYVLHKELAKRECWLYYALRNDKEREEMQGEILDIKAKYIAFLDEASSSLLPSRPSVANLRPVTTGCLSLGWCGASVPLGQHPRAGCDSITDYKLHSLLWSSAQFCHSTILRTVKSLSLSSAFEKRP